MFNPGSTYRIQFHKDFTFKQLKEIIPYLQKLGVKTIYASPIFEATPGSMHGYDVVDPLKVNPEIGTLDELREISKILKQLEINWLQDIVPNHMAYHPNNKWLIDVLEKGQNSEYASYFDIEWNSTIYDGRIMVPFLGVSFDEAVNQKQIQLVKKDGRPWLTYFDQYYPVNEKSIEPLTSAYIKKVNNDSALLKTIAVAQAYQLCHWQETDRQINYRRFFTVNGLICLNMQHEEVFAHYHQFIKQLLEEGIFQGLRVDHIDGLYDPEGYLTRLRRLAGQNTYISVEKILEQGEDFPAHWPVQGNTGYDFLAIVNNLFTSRKSLPLFEKNYKKLSGNKKAVATSIAEKKTFILKQHMAGELDNLCQLFKSSDLISEEELKNVDDTLKETIAQLLIHCPVYRFYGNALPLKDKEVVEIEKIFNAVSESDGRLKSTCALLRDVLLIRPLKADENYRKRAVGFYQRLMQFSGPLMAKGVEDTLMYSYNRFIAHNEVGDAPDAFGISQANFHQLMLSRQQNWPLSINATSTHDTKRGEDVRARLNVLSDVPDIWFEHIGEWDFPSTIHKNDAYFIYQTIVGAHPMPQSDEDNFRQRMQEYLVKALREGKQSSDWARPNEDYERVVAEFIAKLLDQKSLFKTTFDTFHQQISDFGIINSLAQVLLKFTCPGIPDVYQGCDLWDLSLVDPDNRRPVDYRLRENYLKDKPLYDGDYWQHLWEDRYSGQIKSSLTARLFELRKLDEKVFEEGEYIPLTVSGKYQQNILAFARQYGKSWYIVIVPLHLATIGADNSNPLQFDWQDTAIILPTTAPHSWQHLLTDAKGYVNSSMPVSSVLSGLPVALIKLEQSGDRGAGLLLHVSSLPSDYAIGDVGPQAHRFVDFLFNGGQRYWQMLPVNPVDKGAGYSPYSSTSSMAGNVMLISPEMLANNGLLSKDELTMHKQASTNRVDFDAAFAGKAELLNKAYERFKQLSADDQIQFEQFKSMEAYWLDDFALYQAIKQNNNNKPWYLWPKPLKSRDTSAVKKALKQYSVKIDQEKWLQFIFSEQWRLLKTYADKKGVTLFGDMPFYISYDSVDVWSNPELFKLDKNGDIAGIAGVPPDYFSADGQLWGMPVYNWDALKQTDYKWWLQRVRKNLEYFDLIRLDHFRAFSAYWEVPGGEKTAINGKWVNGPGSDFFTTLKSQLGTLPFVAEDLGDIDKAVIDLKNQFNLPGMAVLQFAFGDDMPQSVHIPHNHTVNSFAYTGTHDNNTTKGWFNNDIEALHKRSIDLYAGIKLSGNNICDYFNRLCYSSVAKVAILPVQDVLGLDDKHRMNVPSSANGNWTWRVTDGQLNEKVAAQINQLSVIYNR